MDPGAVDEAGRAVTDVVGSIDTLTPGTYARTCRIHDLDNPNADTRNTNTMVRTVIVGVAASEVHVCDGVGTIVSVELSQGDPASLEGSTVTLQAIDPATGNPWSTRARVQQDLGVGDAEGLDWFAPGAQGFLGAGQLDDGTSFQGKVLGAPAADGTAPVIVSSAATPGALWPPNHRMVPVALAVVAKDNCSPSPTCEIVAVTSDEDGEGDWRITGPLSVDLRAERSGRAA